MADRRELMKELSAMEGEQSTWIPHWKDLSENFMPRRGRALFDPDRTNRGEKLNRKMIDPTPALSTRVLASGMMAGLTSPARPWFRLITPDPALMQVQSVREWLYIVELRMREIFSKSNFYNGLYICYKDLGVIGTHAQTIMEDAKSVIRCYPYAPGRYYIATSNRQEVDTLFVDIPMTARQAQMEYGYNALSTRTRNLVNDPSKRHTWIKVVQAIKPNTENEYGKSDSRNLPYASCHFEKDCPEEEPGLLRESGFYEFPGLVARWDLAEGEDIYGSSPAMDVLGGSRALQLQQKRKAQAIDKHVDPPMAAHPDLKHQRTSLLPGDVTYTPFSNTGGAPGFQPVYTIKPEISALLEDIQEMKSDVRQAMYVDLFLMLTMTDRRQITAEEIRERHEEKLLMLGPVLERLNMELLDPAIDRTFAIMLRRGMVPPAPPEIQGQSLKIEYISILAQAQRLIATSGIERLTSFVSILAEGQVKAGMPPTVMDKLNFDEAVDEYAFALGTAPQIIYSDDDVAAARESRAQEQQAQQLAAAAQPLKDAATAGKTMSETPLNGGNALEQVLGMA